VRLVTTVPAGGLVDSDPLAHLAALPGLVDAVGTARAAVDTLLRHRVLRRRSAEVTAEASLRSARASAAMEGHDVPLETLRAHLLDAGAGTAVAADPAATDLSATDRHAIDASAAHASAAHAGSAGRVDPVALGAIRLYGELGALASAWEHAPRQALARMHVLAARGIVADSRLGRPASTGETNRDAFLDLGPAPTQAESAGRLEGLTTLLMRPTSAPAIVVAAVVHGELLALRLFGSVDGVVARAAARLVLISRGLDPKAVTATDVGHREAGADGVGYAEAARGYIAGGLDGVRLWVDHCCRAVELGARESLAICEALARTP
jgi:hypothetical protein